MWLDWIRSAGEADVTTLSSVILIDVTVLLDIRMADGSRNFAALPHTVAWDEVRDHVEALQGARLTGFVMNATGEAWLDFAYAGYDFSINNQVGELWFFVEDASCPEPTLLLVADHFGALLGEEA